MDNIVLTSIIAAAAACLGALIPSVFSYLGKKEEYVLGRLAKIDDVKLQASTNKVMLYSGPDLSNLVIDYYNTLVERTNSGRPLLHNEQEEFLTEIVNAMRTELGITKAKLMRVRLIRA